MKKVRNIAVIVLSVICVGILVFLLWNLRSTEESAQELIPEVQPEPMSEQSVSDSDVSGNGAENSADPTELPETPIIRTYVLSHYNPPKGKRQAKKEKAVPKDRNRCNILIPIAHPAAPSPRSGYQACLDR